MGPSLLKVITLLCLSLTVFTQLIWDQWVNVQPNLGWSIPTASGYHKNHGYIQGIDNFKQRKNQYLWYDQGATTLIYCGPKSYYSSGQEICIRDPRFWYMVGGYTSNCIPDILSYGNWMKCYSPGSTENCCYKQDSTNNLEMFDFATDNNLEANIP